jgi:TonB family protein
MYETVQYNPELIPIIMQLPDIPLDKQTSNIELSEKNSSNVEYDRSNNKPNVPVVEYKPILPMVDTSRNQLINELLKRHKSNLTNEKPQLNDSIQIILEKAPLFPGGYAAVQSYFYKNQHYPPGALLTGIQGSTIVSFVVNAKGLVEDVKVVSGVDPELDMEAVRLVKTMPPWQPAIYKGKPIACMLIMPVNFTIR